MNTSGSNKKYKSSEMSESSEQLHVKTDKNGYELDYNQDNHSPDSYKIDKSSSYSESKPPSPTYSLGPKKRLLENYNHLEPQSGVGGLSSDSYEQLTSSNSSVCTNINSAGSNSNNNSTNSKTPNITDHRSGNPLLNLSFKNGLLGNGLGNAGAHNGKSNLNTNLPLATAVAAAAYLQAQGLSSLGQQRTLNSAVNYLNLHNFNNMANNGSNTIGGIMPGGAGNDALNSRNDDHHTHHNNNNNAEEDEENELDDEVLNEEDDEDDTDLGQQDDNELTDQLDADVNNNSNGLNDTHEIITKQKSNNEILYEMNLKNLYKTPRRGKSKFKRADCWNYFVTKFCKRTNLYFDHCTIEKNGHVCGSKFVHHGATTRLNKHLIQKHNIKLAVVNKNNEAVNGLNEVGEQDTKSHIMSNAHNQYNHALTAAVSNMNQRGLANNFESSGHIAMNGHHPASSSSLHNNAGGHFDHGHLGIASKMSNHSISMACQGGSWSAAATAHNSNTNNSNSKSANFSDSNMLLVSFILSSSTSIDLLENKWFRMFIENLNSSYKLPTKDELNGMFKNLYKDKKMAE